MSETSRPGERPRPGDQLTLFGGEHPAASAAPASLARDDADATARQFAVDARHHVVLEASAGTGKTSVLVARYVNLLHAGVDPANILAMTFTRKAAAEMRERIVGDLRAAAGRSEFDKARWKEISDRLGDIAISTIDAFCLSLLREFPLEADLDPGFEMADETEVPRLIEDALDRSLRILTGLARSDEDVALVLAQLGLGRTREGLATLLDRRLVASDALDRFLARGPKDLTARIACRRAATAVQDVLRSAPGGLAGLFADGPTGHPRYGLLMQELARLQELEHATDGAIRGVLDRLAAHFLTADGTARRSGAIHPYRAADYPSPAAAKRHRSAVFQVAPQIEAVVFAFARDLNAVLARGLRKMFAIALEQYRRALDERSVLDFADVLDRAVALLRQMDEFAQSRFRLESRYHHVLVDEFQDTSRAQWELVALLIRSWGEGLGLATEPSVFVVGDRKQSIYRFRDAEVAVLEQAARHIEALRPGGSPRRSIARSFRAVPELLEFYNEFFSETAHASGTRADDFVYSEADRFPVDSALDPRHQPVLGIAADDDPAVCAAAVASEIARILREDSVRDRHTRVARQASAGDIAILFRSRASHREFQRELEHRGIPAYVYKGLGFFDADETKDLVALLRFLANPESGLRATAFLRSRFVRLSDEALAALAPDLSRVLTGDLPASFERLGDEDRSVLAHARKSVTGWLDRVDRMPPAELLESILLDSAYAFELRGARRQQAWENVKKLRGLVRRIQNRGYATLTRIANHIDSLSPGDESNAVLEAQDAVNLMTVHASKGLEFPVVFVVNMAKGASGPPQPVRVRVAGDDEPSVSIGPFVSDTDEADRERERHETRRLLYVALTRARDRLYLSSALKEGVLAPGRGSLAEVLPDSIRDLFSRAASAPPDAATLSWVSRSGRLFDWRVCRPTQESWAPAEQDTIDDGNGYHFPDFTADAEHGVVRQGVTEWLEGHIDSEAPAADSTSDASLGALVHRLFESSGRLESVREVDKALFARGLLSDGERAGLADVDTVVAAAIGAWRSLRTRPDVVEFLGSGEPFHEVPFSFFVADTILRGTIDLLIRRPDGSIAVAEFKTGSPRALHRAQLELYVRAAQTIFPGTSVEGRLFYL